MSLLTICQAVVKTTGIGDVPATIIGNTDKDAVQLLALTEEAMEQLSKMNWERLLREHTITTADGTEDYALPSDWARYVSETAWDASNYWQMRGSIDPSEWQRLKRGGIQTSVRKKFRLRGARVMVIPTPSAVETLIIEYARNTPWTDSTGATYKTVATADTDVSLVPEHIVRLELKWRYKHAKGLNYEEDKREAERQSMLGMGQDTPAPDMDFGAGFSTPFLLGGMGGATGAVTAVTATAPVYATSGSQPNISLESTASEILFGRYSSGAGNAEEITLGLGLSLSATGVLSAPMPPYLVLLNAYMAGGM